MKKSRLILLWLLISALLFAGCGEALENGDTDKEAVPPSQNSEASSEPVIETTESKIESLISQMSLREKVGQLFMIRPDALDFDLPQEEIDNAYIEGVTELDESLLKNLSEYPAGGIVIFSKNLKSPEQIKAFNEELQKNSKIPLFISVDEEGGQVARLANHPDFDLPAYYSAYYAVRDGGSEKALQMGDTIGKYLHSFGFNMDFAPVADVNTNPNNPVIGVRAFSSDPHEAAKMASAFSKGLRDNEIIPVFKHFPGHGDTNEDSHYGIAVNRKNLEELKACELIPFAEASAKDCIMAGHIASPNISDDMTPASLSHKMITEILKEELGFDGLVVTDSLSMGAIINYYTPAQASLSAIKAGCHILLMPNDYKTSFDSVVSAVEKGEITEEEINGIVNKILTFKFENGILVL